MTVIIRGCEYCEPKVRTSGHIDAPNHHLGSDPDASHWRLTLNGELVNGCVEVVTGPGGWALLEIGNPADYERYGIKGYPHSKIAACGCGLADGTYGLGGMPRVLDVDDGYEVTEVAPNALAAAQAQLDAAQASAKQANENAQALLAVIEQAQ